MTTNSPIVLNIYAGQFELFDYRGISPVVNKTIIIKSTLQSTSLQLPTIRIITVR